MRLRRLALACSLLSALPLIGCAGGAAEEPAPSFQAVARGQALELDNRSGRTVFYRAFHPDLAARTRWVPCTDTTACDHLVPNAGAQLPLEQVAGYAPSTREVVVFWWFATPDSSGTDSVAADSVRSVLVGI